MHSASSISIVKIRIAEAWTTGAQFLAGAKKLSPPRPDLLWGASSPLSKWYRRRFIGT